MEKRCNNCNSEHVKLIFAECCEVYQCKLCWKSHRCDKLTDSQGFLVALGDYLRHIDDVRIYKVSEITPTFTKGQTCVGERVLKTRLDGKRHVLRTRLMEIVRA